MLGKHIRDIFESPGFRKNPGSWLNTTPSLINGTNMNATVFDTTWIVDISTLVNSDAILEYYIVVTDSFGYRYSIPIRNLKVIFSAFPPNYGDILLYLIIITLSLISLIIFTKYVKKRQC